MTLKSAHDIPCCCPPPHSHTHVAAAPTPAFHCRLMVALGSLTYGDVWGGGGSYKELIFAKDKKRELLVVKMCKEYQSGEVRGVDPGSGSGVGSRVLVRGWIQGSGQVSDGDGGGGRCV